MGLSKELKDKSTSLSQMLKDKNALQDTHTTHKKTSLIKSSESADKIKKLESTIESQKEHISKIEKLLDQRTAAASATKSSSTTTPKRGRRGRRQGRRL